LAKQLFTTFYYFSQLPASWRKTYWRAGGVLFRRVHGNSADRKRRRNNASARSTQAKQLFTTFYNFPPRALALLQRYSAAS
jgi:hypothetical protein